MHFDGHGTYVDNAATSAAVRGSINQHLYSKRVDHRPGKHGYLVFENRDLPDNMELVNGPDLGELLYQMGVPLLVLNACRSAHAETPDDAQTDDQAQPNPNADQDANADSHSRIRAFGSLAQEVMSKGVTGVVAMRYNVYVVTAAQFVADFYAKVSTGASVGQAVSYGRKQLNQNPYRQIADTPIPLQDWLVPIVYEALPLTLLPARPAQASPRFTVQLATPMPEPARGVLHPKLPRSPDMGFYGRDEALLALDRRFDHQRIVLLHAYAGSGKTTTVAEFARWYSLTGGVQGPVLFTSFEYYTPLARVLDTFGDIFARSLEAQGIHWMAIADMAQRRDQVLQVLRQIPVLWIWDNVEPIAGFPSGTESAWSAAEQQELRDFLRDLRETQAKLLLTSRREEREWLGDLPARIALGMMPMHEREQMTRGIAEKHGVMLTAINDWRPLLRYTRGNPLTITVVVGQALREGRTSEKQLSAFTDELYQGAAAFTDDEREGRTRSLGASLSYGFAHAFSEAEQAKLAVLHLFHSVVAVETLRVMGEPRAEWSLPLVRGMKREAWIALLERAAEIGLLHSYGGGYYGIHPALPWYFHDLFTRYHPAPNAQTPAPAVRAYVETMGQLGDYYMNQYIQGNRWVVDILSMEEPNLRHARQLARTHGWYWRITSTMQGLRMLYEQTGRRAEWQRLVDEIIPDFCDQTGGDERPIAGREQHWSLVMSYRVDLAMEARQWQQAERLQQAQLDWNRQAAAAALALPADQLDNVARNTIRTLAVSLEDLADIQREQGNPACVAGYAETAGLFQRIGDQAQEAITAFNLGHAYKDIPAIRDLAAAEQWYERSLTLFPEQDTMNQAKGLGQLGFVAWKRFNEAREAGAAQDELVRHLNNAADYYHQALNLIPANAIQDRATGHGQLGNIYDDAGMLEQALEHYNESIRLFEQANSFYQAALTRYSVALTLARAGRLREALVYAESAEQGFASYGAGAAADVEQARWLVGQIRQDLAQGGG